MRFSAWEAIVVEVWHLELVDHVRNHDKFYLGILNTRSNEVWFQYGRNGTVGQSTPRKKVRSIPDAWSYIQDKIDAKQRKGYEYVDSYRLSFSSPPTPHQVYSRLFN
jgi:predicted DNA-binding WGR domain protein